MKCCECETEKRVVQLKNDEWWCVNCLYNDFKWQEYLEKKEKEKPLEIGGK